MTPREPHITIENTPLSVGQAMAVRVAVAGFLMDLEDEEYRKGIGKGLADAYRARLSEVALLMARANKGT